MPPKRKSAAARSAATRQQQTLSFHGKSSRVTKPSSTTDDFKIEKKDPSLLEDATIKQIDTPSPQNHPDPPVKTEPNHSTPAPDPLASDANLKVEDVLGGRAHQSDTGAVGGKDSGWVADEEATARKVKDSQIKKYWRQKEELRKAPRVHQDDLTLNEKILREWDMSGQYGPCIGIARLKRWKRANVLGLEPPIEVLAVLLKELEKGQGTSQTSHVDELMNSRFAEN